MNDTIIHIDGIKILHEMVSMEDSTDKSHTIVIKDEFDNQVYITIIYGKIISTVCQKK